jgi:hypothetical protein
MTPDNLADFLGADSVAELRTVLNQVVGAPTLTVVGFVAVAYKATEPTEAVKAKAERTGVGQWNLTPPKGAMVAVGSIVEPRETRDDIVLHLENPLATQITMSEQDNGGTAGVVRDNGFTVVWYGKALK